MSERFRPIPTTLLDQYIIESNNTINVDDSLIQKLENESDLDLDDSEGLIKEYLLERTKKNIAVKIQFGYQLPWKFDALRIVDCPGVHAVGGIENVAYDYFKEANAILFITQIKPIESKSLRKFVKSVIQDRDQETLFLILTHAGQLTQSEADK